MEQLEDEMLEAAKKRGTRDPVTGELLSRD
jgi:hypothetical protein